MDGGAWWATVHGVAKSRTRLNDFTFFFHPYLACQVALVVGDPLANAGDIRDLSLIPGSRRCPGEGNGNPLQYSCLGNPTDRGTWWATIHGVAKSLT